MDTIVAGLNQALHHEMATDPSVVLMGCDVGALGGIFHVTSGLLERFPDRVFETPISEGAYAGMGIGAAIAGRRAIVDFGVLDFIWLACDQIANAGNMHFVTNGQVSVPVVFRGPCGFGTGFGVTHSQHFEAIFASRPGVKVVMPSTPADAKGLLTAAIRDPNPVVFVEEAVLYYKKGEVGEDGTVVPLGSGRVAREGGDCTVASAGRCVHLCVEVADQLAAAGGPDVEVIDLRSLKPVDWELLQRSVEKTGRFAAALDGPPFCSYVGYLAGEVAQRSWSSLQAAPVAIAGEDVAAGVSIPAEASAGITAEQVAEQLRALVGA
jgi:pyruvate/2-oxoglutarate/acetoin dehydrogenase E1 component